eukprot:g824.t1
MIAAEIERLDREEAQKFLIQENELEVASMANNSERELPNGQDMLEDLLDTDDIQAIIFEEDVKVLTEERLEAMLNQRKIVPASDPAIEEEVQRRVKEVLGEAVDDDLPRSLGTELDLSV